ncbi:MAG: TolC family protein [Phycisphaera sp.]|nr:TolC family protein [Phycisphaera sp.]
MWTDRWNRVRGVATARTARTVLSVLAALGAAMTLTACGAGPLDADPYEHWPRRDAALNSVRERLRSETGSTAAPARERSAVNPDTLRGPDDYVRLAIARNPSIRKARQTVARLAERVPQVTSLSDPMFQVAPFGEMAETAAGQVGLMAGLSQKLPTPGKLSAAGRIAAQDVAMAVADLNQTTLDVVAETRRAYWMYYFTTRAIDATHESHDLLDQFRQIAGARLRANAATQQDVLRASVELSTLDSELITLGQQRTTAIAMLNQMLDRPGGAELPEPTPVDLQAFDLKLDALLATAATSSPAMRKVRERIEMFREQSKLAKLNRIPDVTVSANYVAVKDEGLSKIANGDDQWWFGFAVNLPIWDAKLDAAEREAHRGVMEGLSDLQATNNRVAFQVQDAYSKVEADQRLAILFRDVIIPQAQQTVDASRSGYTAGKVDFLTLVDNWRKLLNFEVMYHRNTTRLEQDFADLQRVVGKDLARQSPAADHDASTTPTPSETNNGGEK